MTFLKNRKQEAERYAILNKRVVCETHCACILSTLHYHMLLIHSPLQLSPKSSIGGIIESLAYIARHLQVASITKSSNEIKLLRTLHQGIR